MHSLPEGSCRPARDAVGSQELWVLTAHHPSPNRLPLHSLGMAPNSVRLTSSDSLPEHLLLLQSELKRQQGNDFYQPNWGTRSPFCGQGTRNWWTRPTGSTESQPLDHQESQSIYLFLRMFYKLLRFCYQLLQQWGVLSR